MMQKFIDGHKIIFKSTSNTPSASTIKKTFKNLPIGKLPVVFETKTQYLNEYIKNQEKKKGIKFTQPEKQQYRREELADMKNITSRYTTRKNPYIDPRIVFFTDKLSKQQFPQSAAHETAHVVWERNPRIRQAWKSIPRTTAPTPYGRTDKQEDFAESFMLKKQGLPLDPARNRVLKDVHGLNGVSDALGYGYPPEVEFSNEWKLFGRPKQYTPVAENIFDLKGQVQAISLLNNRAFAADAPEVDTTSPSRRTPEKQLTMRSSIARDAINKVTSGFTGPTQEGTDALNKLNGMEEYFESKKKEKRIGTDETSHQALYKFDPLAAEEGPRSSRGVTRKGKEVFISKRSTDIYTGPHGTIAMQRKQGVSAGKLPTVDELSYYLDTSPTNYIPKNIILGSIPSHKGAWATHTNTPEQEGLMHIRPIKTKTKEFVQFIQSDPRQIPQLITHELGHFIDEKHGLRQKYREAGLSPQKAPSKYARDTFKSKGMEKGIAEDLAESFAVWHSDVGTFHPKAHYLPRSREGVMKGTPEEEEAIRGEEVRKRNEFFDTHLGKDFKKGKTAREEYEEKMHPSALIQEGVKKAEAREAESDSTSKQHMYRKQPAMGTARKDVYVGAYPYQKIEVEKGRGSEGHPTVDDIGYFYENMPIAYSKAAPTIALSTLSTMKRKGSQWGDASDKAIRIFPTRRISTLRTEESRGLPPSMPSLINQLLIHETGHLISPEAEKDFMGKFDINTTPTGYPLKVLQANTRRVNIHAPLGGGFTPASHVKAYNEALLRAKESGGNEDFAESFALWHPGIGSMHNLRPEGELEPRKDFFNMHFGEDFKHAKTPRMEQEERVSPDALIAEGFANRKPASDSTGLDAQQVFLNAPSGRIRRAPIINEKGRIIHAFVHKNHPGATFIGSGFKKTRFDNPSHIDYLSDTLGHEEVHGVLDKMEKRGQVPRSTSKKFDLISIPGVGQHGIAINPHSAAHISPKDTAELLLAPTHEARVKKSNVLEEKYRLMDENRDVLSGIIIPPPEPPKPERKILFSPSPDDPKVDSMMDARTAFLIDDIGTAARDKLDKKKNSERPSRDDHGLDRALKDAPFVTLYHGTHRKNLPSIFEKGLTQRRAGDIKTSISLAPSIATAKAVSEYGPEHEYDAVWTNAALGTRSDDPKFLKAKEDYMKSRDPVVLKVTVPREFIMPSDKVDMGKGWMPGEAAFFLEGKDQEEGYPKRSFTNRNERAGPYEISIHQTIPPKFIKELPAREVTHRTRAEEHRPYNPNAKEADEMAGLRAIMKDVGVNMVDQYIEGDFFRRLSPKVQGFKQDETQNKKEYFTTIPTERAWEMRMATERPEDVKSGNISMGGRGEGYGEHIKEGFLKDQMEPIRIHADELGEGKLSDATHRLIEARKLGLPKMLFKVVGKSEKNEAREDLSEEYLQKMNKDILDKLNKDIAERDSKFSKDRKTYPEQTERYKEYTESLNPEEIKDMMKKLKKFEEGRSNVDRRRKSRGLPHQQRHIETPDYIREDPVSKDMVRYTTQKFFPHVGKQVETKGTTTVSEPQLNRITIHEKPMYESGKMGDIFKESEHVQIINPLRNTVVRDIKKVGGFARINPGEGPSIDVPLETDILYEPWFEDRGSLVFHAPVTAPPGIKGQILKLATEGDIIETEPHKIETDPASKDAYSLVKDATSPNMVFAHGYGFSNVHRKNIKTVKMNPKDFLKTTHTESILNNPSGATRDHDEYVKAVTPRSSVDWHKKAIPSKKTKVEIPFLEFDMWGRPTGHEGRNTSQAAIELGMEEIPVTIEQRRYAEQWTKPPTEHDKKYRYDKGKVKEFLNLPAYKDQAVRPEHVFKGDSGIDEKALEKSDAAYYEKDKADRHKHLRELHEASEAARKELEEMERKRTPEEKIQLMLLEDEMLKQDVSKDRVIMFPTEKAYEMRRRGSGLREMRPKRTPETMQQLKASMSEKGFTEPIPATERDVMLGILREGKHRLITAKELDIKEVPVEVK